MIAGLDHLGAPPAPRDRHIFDHDIKEASRRSSMAHRAGIAVSYVSALPGNRDALHRGLQRRDSGAISCSRFLMSASRGVLAPNAGQARQAGQQWIERSISGPAYEGKWCYL